LPHHHPSTLLPYTTLFRSPPALTASDIRKVLSALPLNIQLPLLCVWQSSVEINRVLSLTWGQTDLRTYPVQLSFYGRKKHRQSRSEEHTSELQSRVDLVCR